MSKAFLLLFLFLNIHYKLPAQEVILGTDKDIYKLESQLEYYEDKNNKLDIADITSLTFENKFKPVPKNLHLGTSYSTFWIRFTLSNTSKNTPEWLLVLENPTVEYTTLYFPKDNNNRKKISSGARLLYEARPFNSRNFVFQLSPQTKF